MIDCCDMQYEDVATQPWLENPLWDKGWEWCSLREILGFYVRQCPCKVDCKVKIYISNVCIVAIEVHEYIYLKNNVFANINEIIKKHMQFTCMVLI